MEQAPAISITILENVGSRTPAVDVVHANHTINNKYDQFAREARGMLMRFRVSIIRTIAMRR